MLAQVAQTRRNGDAFSRGTVTDGVGIIAMALPPGAGVERIGIGVGGPQEWLERGREGIVTAMTGLIARYAKAIGSAGSALSAP